MLVLTRKLNERIQIGDNITVSILRIKGNTVRVGIEAPRDVRIVREELPPKPLVPAKSTDRRPLKCRPDGEKGETASSRQNSRLGRPVADATGAREMPEARLADLIRRAELALAREDQSATLIGS